MRAAAQLDEAAAGLVGTGAGATREHAARALWSCVTEPGDRVTGALLRRLGAEEAWTLVASGARAADVAAGAGVERGEARSALARWEPRLDPGLFTDAVERARRVGAVLLVPDDDAWPGGLRELGDHAPACLWVRGAVGRLAAPSVALVGARAATSYGELVAADLAAGLADSGLTVVSGAAYGIDGAAHRAALTADGTTVAFLAGGCDRGYPSGHTDLLRRIVATGAVASEVPCGAAPTRWRFLQRNRLIAAAAAATVVVEAGLRSGSLNTAGHAAALGRPLGAVPGPVTSAASAGTHRLLREFDAVCVTSAAEVRELLGLAVEEPPASGGHGSAERTRVLDALSIRVARSAAEVARRSGMSIAEVEATLGSLSLEEEAEADAEGWRRRRRA